MADNHYTEGRRYSHIHKAWILESSWNDSEEIAALRAQLADMQASRDFWHKNAHELDAIVARRDAEVGRLREALDRLIDYSAPLFDEQEPVIIEARAALKGGGGEG